MNNELWLIWKHNKTRRRYQIASLVFQDNKYIFKYESPELSDAINAGFDYFPGFEDINQVYESTDLFSNIKTRLPNKQRPDYLDILNKYNLTVTSSLLDILATTKGRLITDNYEFVRKFDKDKIEFDVAGCSHSKDFENIKDLLVINDKVVLEMDTNNIHDPYAIKVMIVKNYHSHHLGFVPRYYSKEIFHLLNEKKTYSSLIKNLNFENEIYDKDMMISIKLIFEE